ncbi:putative ribonuclease H-like domain-containing protein [Tanacetum coccineum]
MKKMYCLVVIDDYSRFTWLFFLATKDETSGILKSFITRIENLMDHKVKVIRCDNGIEFENREMNHFCDMKGIVRQFSVAITPQQNGVAERRNRTLIEAARTMLADSKLPTTFWAKAVNTACYVQNRVLIVKPHNKTPYELFHGRTPTLSFMRPFGCPVTILNTIDHLGKFDGKANEGFFVGYSLNSKAFRVFNSKTRIVEENLHIRFNESTPNAVGTKASDIAGQARKETEPVKNYILLPLWTADPPYSQDPESSHDDGFKPSSDDGKKVDEDPKKKVNVKIKRKKIIIELPYDPNMLALEDDNIFDFTRDDENDGVVADINNLDTTIQDDIIFGSTNKKLCIAFEKLMHEKFQMSSMGELTFFLGLQVQQKKDGIFISQDKYVGEILKKFGFTEVKTASTPMETQKPLLKDEDGEEVDVHMYRSMIGSLMYLTSSRPDIMFAVCACARYQVNPKVSHLHAMKRIFRYLKGQPKLGLWYPKDSPFDLVAYTDSDYAGASLDRKSTIGGCQFLGSRLISWQCKKQTVVANSTTEAEYVAASSCCGQVLWIQNQLLDYRDCNEKKLIQMVKIYTDKNVADLLTKAFDVSRFQYLIASIGMLNP